MKPTEKLTDAEFKKVVSAASQLGEQHGRNAAAWWEQDNIGGRVSSHVDTEEVARRVLSGIEEGDPAVYDSFPQVNLSGEWKDSMTPTMLMIQVGVCDVPPVEESEICDAYETAAQCGVEHEIAKLCRAHLGE